MPSPHQTPVPGTQYKFLVKSAEQAAEVIRTQLGGNARVLSVRTVEAGGLSKLWASPRLEVIAQVDDAKVSETALPSPTTREEAEAASKLFGRQSAQTQSLSSLLRRSGMSEMAMGRLEADPAWPSIASEPLHRGIIAVTRLLQREAERREDVTPLTRAAFIGTPGSGRTTALCKWLGLEVFRRARMGHVLTAEFDKPHSPGVLPVFCEAMGVHVARFPASTQPAVAGGFVYFDLPGLSLRNPADNQPILNFLNQEKVTQRVLVLNAAYDHATLRAAYATGRAMGATHLVFTHLDEVAQWGRLWDYVGDGALKPLFLGTGPSLTGECEDDVWSALIRRTLASAEFGVSEQPAAAGNSEEAFGS